MLRPLAAAALASFAIPAHAHPGGHARMSVLELAQHLAEPDHVAFLAVLVIVGVVAWRWGRSADRAAKARAPRRDGEQR